MNNEHIQDWDYEEKFSFESNLNHKTASHELGIRITNEHEKLTRNEREL